MLSPSCKSRDPKKENVRIFNNVDEALSEGFRPCKRCKPGGIRMPDEEWVVQIKEYITTNYQTFIVGSISRHVSWKSLSFAKNV